MATGVMQVLLNWLWQGTALVIVVGLVVRAIGRVLNAATRERIWWMTLLAVVGIPVVHLLMSTIEAPVGGSGVASHLVQEQRLFVTVPPSGLLVMGTLWVVWMTVSSMRLACGVIRLRSARRLALPAGMEIERRLKTWRQIRSQGRHAALVTSRDVYRAAVIGLGSPLIALAPQILGRLTDEELDQVVVHEYAHVQRRDDLAVLLQGAIMAVAGLHPAVWWLDRALTIEREVACDDWVLARTGFAKRYATCLVGLASAGGSCYRLSLGAVRSGSELSIRVARMLDRDRNQTTEPSRTVLLIARLVMAGLLVAAAALPLVEVAHHADRGPKPPPAMELSLSTREVGAVAAALGTTTRRPSAAFVQREPSGAQLQDRRIEDVSIEAAIPDDSGPLMAVPPRMAVDDIPFVPTDGSTQQSEPGTVSAVLPATSWPWVVSVPRGATASLAAPLPVVPVETELAAPNQDETATSPWDVTWRPAASAGAAIGEGSRHAAVKTAGFFGRIGNAIAGSF